MEGWADYLAFRRRALRRMADLASLQSVQERGVVGAAAASGQPRGGILVLRDAAAQTVVAVLRHSHPVWLAVLEPREELLDALAQAGWGRRQTQWAMTKADLTDLPAVPWPDGVQVHEAAVRHSEGVPLADVLKVELEHRHEESPGPVRDIELEARLMRDLSVRFFGALTPEGLCVATAGCRVVDRSALIAAVVTVPEFRRRGLATAMTRHALEAAAADGAGDAFLDATEAGVGIYTRLGFRRLGRVVYVERSAT